MNWPGLHLQTRPFFVNLQTNFLLLLFTDIFGDRLNGQLTMSDHHRVPSPSIRHASAEVDRGDAIAILPGVVPLPRDVRQSP